jgi:hypothetical protein
MKPRSMQPPYEIWKIELRKDCEMQDKLAAFDAMGEYVLKLLWETGAKPSVNGILEHTWDRPRQRAA